MQDLSQRTIAGYSGISQRLVEADDRAAIHFIMFSVPAVHPDDGSLVAIGSGVPGGPAECLSPVSGESVDMPGVEAVAECMGDYVVRHDPTVPGLGKPAQAVHATCRLKDRFHASMMTIFLCLCKQSVR